MVKGEGGIFWLKQSKKRGQFEKNSQLRFTLIRLIFATGVIKLKQPRNFELSPSSSPCGRAKQRLRLAQKLHRAGKIPYARLRLMFW